MPVLMQTFAVTVTLRKLVQRQNSQAGATATAKGSPVSQAPISPSSYPDTPQGRASYLQARAAQETGSSSGGTDHVDLTPFLAESDAIRTVKSLSQPGGGFTVSFADQLEPALGDTLYALIEPMDLIEIRASRSPQDYVGGAAPPQAGGVSQAPISPNSYPDTPQGRASYLQARAGQENALAAGNGPATATGTKLPLIMRGYVSSVQRSESIGDDGTPQRQIVLHGIDSGKLWQINQVLFQYLQASGTAFLDPFHMQAATGIGGGALPVGQYMQKLVDYMNDKVEKLAAYTSQAIPKFTLDSTVQQGQAVLQVIQDVEGSIWGYVEAFADRPWNEAFLTDEEEGPVLTFRVVPYKRLDTGALLFPDAVDPGTVAVDALEILSMDVNRSDGRVANFFWVPPGSGTLDSNSSLTAASLANAQLNTTFANNNPTLYGERMMQHSTSLIPSDVAGPATDQPAAQRPDINASTATWYTLRATQLNAMNVNNALYEEGGAVLNGSEYYAIGKYLSITRGAVVSEAYMTQVAHVISPLRSWTTQVTLERGTGFYQRDKNANSNPFFDEGRGGPYTT